MSNFLGSLQDSPPVHMFGPIEQQKDLADAMKKVAEKPKVNLHLELVNKKETNIDKNYGPNIENNGMLTLPNKDDK